MPGIVAIAVTASIGDTTNDACSDATDSIYIKKTSTLMSYGRSVFPISQPAVCAALKPFTVETCRLDTKHPPRR